MIIRRRHTANFTTIGNALFDDERLAADEVGVLAFLLSRPNDWEVRRPSLMRRWHVGPDTIKRVMRNLIKTGWCRAQKTRLSNGTFHIVYEIRDEHGRELTEEEVIGALSLVSSGATDTESEDHDPADHPGQPDSPPPSQPGVVNQGVATPPWPSKSLLNPELPRTESTQLARAFSDVCEGWPAAHVLSVIACETLHASLTDVLKEAAYQGVKPYLADCRIQSRKVCDLATYYRERRWERFLNKAHTAEFYVVQRGTPQAGRWREWLDENEPWKIATFDHAMNGRGYTAPTEWPPAKGARRSGTDPPATLTEQDAREIENF